VKPFRPLFAAAAAAGLLAAGCDYWQNLVDDKVVTHTALDVMVLDAWTRQPLSDAVCKDAGRGLEWTTDANGRIAVSNAETGQYLVSCVSPSYHDAAIGFPLTRAGAAVAVPMARRGGADWYPDDVARQVGIINTKPQDPFKVQRFPSPVRMLAGPEDSLSRFLYIWKFAKASRLNREANSVHVTVPWYEKTAMPPDVEDGMEDTLTLIVRSRLNGKANEYEVGTYRRVFTWAKNNLPILNDIKHEWNDFTVGCPEPESQPLRVVFSASDIDGDCPDVRFWSADTASSLGNVDTTLLCRHSRPLILPLRNTFPTLRTDAALFLDNKLYLSATDANGGKALDSIEFRTKTNIQPTISAFIEGRPQVVFTGEEIRVHFEAHDSLQAVGLVTTIWGNGDRLDSVGETSKDYSETNAYTVRGTMSHIYDKTDIQRGKSVTVRIVDKCHGVANAHAGTFDVRINSAPEIETFSFLTKDSQSDSTTHLFRLGIRDNELSQDLDSITQVKINWGDGTSKDYADLFRTAPYIRSISHQFKTPPPSPAGYQISISVVDSHTHNGVGSLDTLMAVP
jgi:hypothetical protein